MANVFTLDALRDEVEKDYAPVELVVSDGSEIVLRNLLRLPLKEREAVVEKLKELEEVSDDMNKVIEVSGAILALVADNGRKLTKELGDDAALTIRIFEVWMETAQPGEANTSPE